MTGTFIELSEVEFDQRYPLLVNHLNSTAGWAVGDAGGCLFETYGAEFAFVRDQDPATVWTLLDGDCGNLFLASGLHFVNRIGYLVSTLPVPDDVLIEVRLEVSDEGEPLESAT